MPTWQVEWKGHGALDALQRDASVEVSEGKVHLFHRVLLADEMGDCTGRDVEPIYGQVRARKDLQIDGLPDHPVARGARLSIWLRCATRSSALIAEVNSHRLSVSLPVRDDSPDAYWHLNWPTVEVPVEWLHPGLNSITLQSQDGAVWETLIETCRHPGRSARSIDGGATWDWDHLGYNSCYDGEYLVRLELDRYASGGTISSDPADLAGRENGLSTQTAIHSVALTCVADTPEGTAVILALRAGPTPVYDSSAWSAWAAPEAFRARPTDRFFQWQATLRTANPLATPFLHSVRLSAEGQHEAAGWGRLVAEESQPITRSSHPFGTQAPYSRATLLRERWGLDQVVADARDDWERILRLAIWSRDQWTDGWQRDWKALRVCPPWDAPLILESGRHNLGVGMCTHYSTVFVQACASFGIPARQVIHRAHCTAEAWSDRWGKWVWLDVGGDPDDGRRAVYFVEGRNAPLSALEAREAWQSGETASLHLEGRGEPDRAFRLEDRLAKLDHWCIVLRNDQLTSPHPGELEHGIVAYHYDGYLWWRDTSMAPLPYFTLSSSRVADFYWTPNRTRVHLQRTGQRGTLRVHLETTMPNVAPGAILGPAHHPAAVYLPTASQDSPAGLQVRRDRGDWQRCQSEFLWCLRAGANELAARAVNAFGGVGPAAGVTVDYAE